MVVKLPVVEDVPVANEVSNNRVSADALALAISAATAKTVDLKAIFMSISQ